MVLPDFLICLSIMPSLKAQLFLVKKLSWTNCGVILREFNIKSEVRYERDFFVDPGHIPHGGINYST